MNRNCLTAARRIVVKIGSSLLTDDGIRLNVAFINDIARQVASIRGENREVLVVSSGSIAAGMQQFSWRVRPQKLVQLQAAAAAGQARLIQTYDNAFITHRLHAAQILLTAKDIADRISYLNARATLLQLLKLEAVPIVNENDTVATYEMRFGDNDRLAALVCNMIDAQLLILLTDQPGVYRDFNQPDTLLPAIDYNDEQLMDMIEDRQNSFVGTGGMRAKLEAAKIASRSNTQTVIASGKTEAVLEKILRADEIGTLLYGSNHRLPARKQWLATGLSVKGKVEIDHGAMIALTQRGRSLLPVGVIDCAGDFAPGDIIDVYTDGNKIASGISNYSQTQLSSWLAQNKPTKLSEEVIHRDNLTLV